MSIRHEEHIPSSMSPTFKRYKRPRPSYVCKRCRALKIKCNKESPCVNCAEQQVQCTYETHGERSATRSSNHARPGNHDPSQSLSPAVDWDDSESAASGARLRGSNEHSQTLPSEQQASSRAPIESIHDWTSNAVEQVEVALEAIVAMIPPIDCCLALLQEFYAFDLMFRFVHRPSFHRSAERLLALSPNLAREDIPSLAALSVALHIGVASSRSSQWSRFGKSIESLQTRTFRFCEGQELFQSSFSLALTLDIYRHLVGSHTSPTSTWIVIGKAAFGAALAAHHKDTPSDTFAEIEHRRRTWWHIEMCKRLKLEITPATSLPVPRPLVISDEQLDDPNKPTSVIPEWAYIDAKINFTTLWHEIAHLESIKATPTPVLMSQCQQRLDDYWNNLPEFLKQTSVEPHQPPWVFAQACIMGMGFQEAVMEFYRHHLAATDALGRCLLAARSLITSAQAYVQHILFRWIDAQPDICWSFGSKVFRAGTVLAFALLIDETAGETATCAVALDTAVGLLRSAVQGSTSSMVNQKAVETLLRLRNSVRSGMGDGYIDHIVDPYTNKAVPIPNSQSATSNQADSLLGLTEWDDLDLESFLNSLL